MVDEKETARISKFLSLVLRHQPQTIGLTLDNQGWVSVTDLLEKLNAAGFAIDLATLQQVVETNNKKRFAFSECQSKIRASQGHSIAVELGYAETAPPQVLFHGTAKQNVAAIVKEGLQKQSRQHVHLSADSETANQVGKRHGKPVVFDVLAGKMYADGYRFFRSANSVWLTDAVPPEYLQLPS